jgi:hypothetical protein
MKCLTLTGFEKVGKTTWGAQFLADMEKVFPWPELVAAVLSVYPKISEHGGRPPIRGADAADLLPAVISVKIEAWHIHVFGRDGWWTSPSAHIL